MENFKLSDDSVANLGRAAKWARVYALASIILLTFSILAIAIAWAVMSQGTGMKVATALTPAKYEMFLGVVLSSCLVILAINIVPMLYLLCFSGKMRRAAAEGDVLTMEHAFRSLKKFFVTSCIMLLVSLLAVLLWSVLEAVIL